MALLPTKHTERQSVDEIDPTTGFKAISDGVTEYKVYYSTTPNRYIDANFYSSVKSNSCTVTGLTNGTTYYFRVSAVVNGLDSSRFSPLSPNSPLLTPTLQLNQATVVPS